MADPYPIEIIIFRQGVAFAGRRTVRLPALAVFPRAPHALSLPLYGLRIVAGFPSPSDDHLEKSLDLNEYLVQHPAATFFVRVQGHSVNVQW